MRISASRLVLLPVASVFLMGVDKGCVTEPFAPWDEIVTVASIKVKGTINEIDAAGDFVALHDGKVTLKKNGTNLAEVSTVDKIWSYNSVSLVTGENKFAGATKRTASSGTISGTIPEFLLERKTDLSDRGTQKVFLDWTDTGVDPLIRDIATATLQPDPSATQLDDFVAKVKDGVKAFFEKAYSGKNIVLTTSSSGSDVHIIDFRTDDNGLFGESPGDYKNQDKTQTSNMYIGTFRAVAIDDPDGDGVIRFFEDTPALATDSLATRIKDVSTWIGRTAVHEFGHSLGLTNESNLHGCEGSHNCEAYDNSNPTDRFDGGHYIMDPGPKSALHARIGVASPSSRTEKMPRFNNYNLSYLSIIH